MKKILLITLLVSVVLISFISAQPTNLVNYTVSSSAQGITITQLSYSPYPANPGEYFDLWVEAQFYGTGYPTNATFILEPQFPFSLDPGVSPMQSFGNIISPTPILVHYRIKVDPDAVQGNNYLDLAYSSNGGNNIAIVQQFNIEVAEAQTSFDLVVQDSTSTATSIGIANTGENTANSLIVRIPDQPGFRTIGTNGQIVGNLASGDYTIATFDLVPTSRSNNSLEVELDYTDAIGVRRSVIENVSSNSIIPTNLTFTGGVTGTYGNFSSSSRQKSSIFTNSWFWIIISAIIVIVVIVILSRFRKKKQQKKDLDHSKKILDNIKVKNREKKDSKEPDWVMSERTKKK